MYLSESRVRVRFCTESCCAPAAAIEEHGRIVHFPRLLNRSSNIGDKAQRCRWYSLKAGRKSSGAAAQLATL